MNCLELFLDTEKAYDNVCHNGLFYRIRKQLTDSQKKKQFNNIYYKGHLQISILDSDQDSNLFYQGFCRGEFLGRCNTHDFSQPKPEK